MTRLPGPRRGTIQDELLTILNQIPAAIEKAFTEAMVLRHPGHGSQKVHGRRGGGGANSDARSIGEAEQWIKGNLGISADYSGIEDVRVANKINNTVSELVSTYGNKQGQIDTLKKITTFSGGVEIGSEMAHGGGASRELSLNSDIWKDTQSFKTFTEKLPENYLVGKSPKSLIAHEFAHNREFSATFLNAKTHNQTQDIFNEWSGDGLSSYARTSRKEMVAEAFVKFNIDGSKGLQGTGLEELGPIFNSWKNTE